jgi:putative tricarboxylic transport membrane protein
MSDMPQGEPQQAPHVTLRALEVAVGVILVLVGLVVAIDSERLGAGWADDGPQAGYFPFYVGLLLALAGGSVLQNVFRLWREHNRPFASHQQLGQVGSVLFPCIVYVAVIYAAGIYVASAAFIGWFMRTHGKFKLLKLVPVSAGVPVVLFLLFEVWFKVALPKGPLERLLGY